MKMDNMHKIFHKIIEEEKQLATFLLNLVLGLLRFYFRYFVVYLFF